MPQEYSLDQAYTLANDAAQKARENPPEEKAPEVKPPAAKPAKKAAEPKELSLDEAYKTASAAQAPQREAAAATAKTESRSSQIMSYARPVATLADMIVGLPGSIAGTVAGQAMYADMEANGIPRDRAGEYSLEGGHEVSGAVTDRLTFGHAHPFNEMLNTIAKRMGDKEPTDPDVVARAMRKISEWSDKGATWVSAKTGNRLTKQEILMELDLAQNTLMAKGLEGVAKIPDKIMDAKAAKAEAAAEAKTKGKGTIYVDSEGNASNTLDPVDGAPTKAGHAAIEQKLRTATKDRDLTDSELARMQNRLGKFLGAKAEVEGRRATRMGKAARQSGAADPKLLAAIAGVTTGAVLARAYPEGRDDAVAIGLGLGGIIGPKSFRAGLEEATLGSILGRGAHTLKTLENLNQNHTEFPAKRLREELRRPEISQAEKDIFEHVLGDTPDDHKISAAKLVRGANLAAGNFHLKGEDTDQWAGYGLESIDRENLEPDMNEEPPHAVIARMQEVLNDREVQRRAQGDPNHRYEDYPHWRNQAENDLRFARQELEQAQQAQKRAEWGKGTQRTTIWRSPIDLGTANHFGDPNYFAHTRSFDEDGVKHVVEIQSDLAQHQRRLSPEELAKAYADHAKVSEELHDMHGALPGMKLRAWGGEDSPELDAALDKIKQARLRQRELANKISAHDRTPATVDLVRPMLKDWHKRLIREELAASARKGERAVRFASADTVAKVEGWPESAERMAAKTQHETDLASAENQKSAELRNYWDARADESLDAIEKTPRFAPEHQGIYDRYSRDVTKFLKSLGAKEVADEHGHTWLEVPTKANGPRAKMFGGATGDMMKTIAGATLGYLLASQIDPEDPAAAGIAGALLGVTAAHVGVGGVKKALGKIFEKDTRTNIFAQMEKHQTDIDRLNRETSKAAFAITELVPKKSARERIHRALDEGKVNTLQGKELEAAKVAQEFYKTFAEAATKLGILDSARANYSTHLWRDSAAAKGLLERKQAALAMNPNSRFNKQRAYLTMQEGKAAGLTPKTEDIAQVLAVYGGSMGRSIANARILETLKRLQTPNGEMLLAKVGHAPHDYVRVDSPYLQGFRVHPDVASSLKYLYEADNMGAAMSAVHALNVGLKRLKVSTSLFHAKSLLEAAMVAGHPFKAGKVALQAIAPRVFGTNKFIEMYRRGGMGDTVDKLLEGGLRVSQENRDPADIDVGGGFYGGMRVLQAGLDKALPHVGGKVAEGAIRLNHAVDNFMWARLQTGLKFEVAAAKMQVLLNNAAKRGERMTEEEAAKIASSYTNSVFGGINWMRAANSVQNAWGRDIAYSLTTRKGLAGLSILDFAPDWTFSTARAFYKAFGTGSGVLRGLARPITEADLFRQQLVRLGFYYITAMNGLNMLYSGHPIWENDDPTRIDRGDGTYLQAAKHSFEAFHWMQKPGQTFLDKMGQLPKEALEQSLDVDYLSAKGHSPPMKSRLGHLAKNFEPMSIEAGQKYGAKGMIYSALGAPIQGKPNGFSADPKKAEAQRRYLDRQKRNKEHQERIESYKKRHGLK